MTRYKLTTKPNPLLPEVVLEIGGKERSLVYDFAAIVAAERVTGTNLLNAAMSVVPTFNEVRGMLFAALLHDDPKLTLAEVDTWPILWNIAVINDAVREAWFGSVPEPKDEASGEAPAQTA